MGRGVGRVVDVQMGRAADAGFPHPERRLGWAEIAAELGGTPDALRVRLARALARITRQLGLGEGPDA
jgi:hypothetical protein